MLWVRISIRARCTTLCDKVCQLLATGQWFSLGISVSKTDLHDITEILLRWRETTSNKQTCIICLVGVYRPINVLHRNGDKHLSKTQLFYFSSPQFHKRISSFLDNPLPIQCLLISPSMHFTFIRIIIILLDLLYFVNFYFMCRRKN